MERDTSDSVETVDGRRERRGRTSRRGNKGVGSWRKRVGSWRKRVGSWRKRVGRRRGTSISVNREIQIARNEESSSEGIVSETFRSVVRFITGVGIDEVVAGERGLIED